MRGPKPTAKLRQGSARVVVLEAGRVTGRYVISSTAVVGRGGGADIVVRDAVVSRHHARIVPITDETYVVEDLGSLNGTFLNGVQVKQGSFGPGDTITLGQEVALKLSRFDPAEQDLRRRERLEALGLLTSGVVHDLNNMVGAILATAEYMRPLVPDAGELHDCLQDIRNAAKRACELAPRLTGFARGASFSHGTVDVTAVCSELVELLTHAFDPSIRLARSIAPKLAVVGDAGELQQALMNLCLNARDAMPDGGDLGIRAARVLPTALPDVPSPGIPHVLVQVSDTGHGMPATTLERIFEPFFSTKGDKGTGIGLASVKEIAALHGGAVRVSSVVGTGSTFEIWLPEAAAPLGEQSPDTVPPRALSRLHGQRLLVVDDDAYMRRSIARTLRREGAEAIEVEGGAEALERYGQQAPDAVVLNLTMPEMSGEETLRRLRKMDEEVAVVVVTGHSDSVRIDVVRMLGAASVVGKPFQTHQLVEAVVAAIAAREVDDEPTTDVR